MFYQHLIGIVLLALGGFMALWGRYLRSLRRKGLTFGDRWWCYWNNVCIKHMEARHWPSYCRSCSDERRQKEKERMQAIGIKPLTYPKPPNNLLLPPPVRVPRAR